MQNRTSRSSTAVREPDNEYDINELVATYRTRRNVEIGGDGIGRFASEISGVGNAGRETSFSRSSYEQDRRRDDRSGERCERRDTRSSHSQSRERDRYYSAGSRDAQRSRPSSDRSSSNRQTSYSSKSRPSGRPVSSRQPVRDDRAGRDDYYRPHRSTESGSSQRSGGVSVERRGTTRNRATAAAAERQRTAPMRRPAARNTFTRTAPRRSVSRSAAQVFDSPKKRLALLIAAGLLVFSLLFIVVFYTIGSKALANRGVFDDICRCYDVVSSYSPDAGKVGSLGSTVHAAEVEELSSADSPTDAVPVFVTEEEILPRGFATISGGKRFSLSLKAGFNQIYASNNDVELIHRCEAGHCTVSASDFAADGNELTFTVPPTKKQLETPGCYILQVSDGKKLSNVILVVQDTTPPDISLSDLNVWLGDEVTEQDFVSAYDDASPMIITFDSLLPDTSVTGDQKLSMRMTDIYGNDAGIQTVKLSVTKDIEPPVIEGVKNRSVILGEAIAYKQGVTLSDNRDTPDDITLAVDSSAVDTKKAGKYTVTYTATDREGNASSASMTLTILTESEQKKEAELAKYVNKVAKSIFKSGMTDTQKLRAIYNWTHAHLRYTGTSIKDNWRDGALRGFKTHAGDCFTYFSCAKALMEYCGFDNIDVVKNRLPGQSRHYWSMVNLGTGWYHFDPCIRHNTFNGFMRTDAQLEAYSKKNDGSHRIDKTKYPATPKEKFNLK